MKYINAVLCALLIILIVVNVVMLWRQPKSMLGVSQSRYDLDSVLQSIPSRKAEMARRVIETYERGGCAEVTLDHHVLATMSKTACEEQKQNRTLVYPEWRHID